MRRAVALFAAAALLAPNPVLAGVVSVNLGNQGGLPLGAAGAASSPAQADQLSPDAIHLEDPASLGTALPASIAPAIEGVAPAVAPAIQAVPAQAAPIAEAVAPRQGVSSNEAREPADQRIDAPARQTLEDGVQAVTDPANEPAAVLDSLFSRSRPSQGGATVLAAGQAASPGDAGSASLEASPSADGLALLASDPTKPEAARKEAVASLARLGGADAKAALLRVAESNPEGNATDYEVHRAALRALAEKFDEVRSLRPVSRAHADEILTKLSTNKPELAAFDKDGTLEKAAEDASPEIGQAIQGASDAGVQVAVLSYRGSLWRWEGDRGLLDSFSSLTPEQKARLILSGESGGRTFMFDRKGVPVLVSEKPSWTSAEAQQIYAAADVVTRRFGEGTFKGRPLETDVDVSPFHAMVFLPESISSVDLESARAALASELSTRGLGSDVFAYEANGTFGPRLIFSKYDKKLGMSLLRANRDRFERLRDVVRLGLSPSGWLGHLLGLLPSPPVPGSKTLVVGDQFFPAPPTDARMSEAAPGALSIAVGGTADPRLDNVFVWPTQGKAASLELLGALAKKPKSAVNLPVVLGGVFAQRTISIIAFLMVAIAYPFIAVSMVGWGGYGTLMSFGNMTAIATGPLIGMMLDVLTTRKAMVLNILLRVALLSALPTFYALGVLNFWTLLIGAMGEGYLLSSIVTTENAFMRRIVDGAKLGTVIDFLMMNFFFLQVLFGLILGIGHIADVTSPIVVYAAAAAANLFLVLPIILLTIPALAPTAQNLFQLQKAKAKADAQIGKNVERINELEANKRGDWELEFRSLQDKNRALEAEKASLQKKMDERRAQLKDKDIPALKASLEATINRSRAAWLRESIGAAERELAGTRLSLGQRVKRFLGKYWLEAAVFAAAVATYPFLGTPLLMAGALVFWIVRTSRFGVIWRGEANEPSPQRKELEEKEQKLGEQGGSVEELGAVQYELKRDSHKVRNAMLFLSLGAFIFYPIQYFTLAKIAEVLSAADKGLIHGQLLGSLFLGNLISLASRANLPPIRLPLLGRINTARLIQAGVLGLAFTWIITTAVPGSVLAATIVTLLAAGMTMLATRFTERGWLQLLGLGFSSIWLPFLVWTFPGLIPFLGVPLALSISMILIGLFNGPAMSSLFGYFGRNTRKDMAGITSGIQGSLFNAAISIGYALLTLVAGALHPAFPATLAVLGAVFLAAGFLYWNLPRWLPGLSPTLFKQRGKK